MEIIVGPSSVSTKINAEIGFNLQRGVFEDVFMVKFELDLENGSICHGQIRCALHCNRILLFVEDSEILNVDLDLNEVAYTVYGPKPWGMHSNDSPIDFKLAEDEIKSRKIIGSEANSLIESIHDKVPTWWGFQLKRNVEFNILKGKFNVTFEPTSKKLRKEKLVNLAGYFQFQQDGNGEDFKIVCEDKEFGFNKSTLAKISPVFKNMFENKMLESQGNRVKIEDATPETIEAFKNVLNNNEIEEDDLSVGLYMWAHKYIIMPLFKLCQDHLGATLCEEGILEVLEVADLYDDEELLSKIAGKVYFLLKPLVSFLKEYFNCRIYEEQYLGGKSRMERFQRKETEMPYKVTSNHGIQEEMNLMKLCLTVR